MDWILEYTVSLLLRYYPIAPIHYNIIIIQYHISFNSLVMQMTFGGIVNQHLHTQSEY